MRILITCVTSTVSRGTIPLLKAAGHEVVLHDLVRLPDNDLFHGLPFIQGDIQAGVGMERAAMGCDLIEKYGIKITGKPSVVDIGASAAQIEYAPKHHFGTFLDALRRIATEGGGVAVAAMRCPY